jgi:hypothetical protein
MARCYDHRSARTMENGAIVKKMHNYRDLQHNKRENLCLIHFSYKDNVINIFREIS